MSLNDTLNDDLESVIYNSTDFATAVTYTPLIGIPKSAAVLISRSVTRVGFESNLNVPHDEASFPKSEISSPKRGDTLNAGSITFELISQIAADSHEEIWLIKEL